MVGEAASSMVCREKELEQLSCCLGEALSGRGGVVILSGPGGIGKSLLAERTEQMAARVGFRCLKGQCLREGKDPADPFPGIFPYLFFEDTPSGPRRRTASPLEVMEAVRSLADQAPLLLVLENIHWARREGAALLHHLARNVRRVRVLILCTNRPEELSITPEGPAPLLETVRLLRREGLCREIELVPLGRRATIDVIERSLDGALDDDLAEQLWQNSGGNPSVAIELARTLVQDKMVEFDGRRWRGREGMVVEDPDTFHELAVRNLGELYEGDRMILECASAAGETFDPSVVSDVLDLDRLQVLERLDEMAKDRHLLIERGDQYQFINRSTHLAAYRGMAAERRRELHSRIARELEARAGSDPGAIALQCFLAGRKESCLCYSLLAGRELMANRSWEEAVECLTRAVESSRAEQDEVRTFVQRELDDALDRTREGRGH